MSFWDFLYYTLVVFAFVVLLMVIFSIIGDIFRNHEMNGFVKALWIIFLVLAPWLTALIYLIVHHKGMAERSQKAAQQQMDAQAAYIKQAAGTGATPADQIASAKKLLDEGSISQAEFDQLKAKALASS
jgi:hypothetical protein